VTVRGVVDVQWRDALGAVIYSTQQVANGGHSDAGGGDPAGFSAMTCTLNPASH
jgi:hypothetical protein